MEYRYVVTVTTENLTFHVEGQTKKDTAEAAKKFLALAGIEGIITEPKKILQ